MNTYLPPQGVFGLAIAAKAAPPTPEDGYTGGPVVLTHTHHGSDGSLFSTRAVGNAVVGFSQDASGQRSVVFKGVRSVGPATPRCRRASGFANRVSHVIAPTGAVRYSYMNLNLTKHVERTLHTLRQWRDTGVQ